MKYESYEMYWSGSVENSKICPECKSGLKNENQAYLVAVKIGKEEDSYVLGGPDISYFCTKCPVVVLDEDVFEDIVRAAIVAHYPDASSFEFAVGGIVDYSAIPEDKRDKELGTDDNPLTIIPLKEHSRKNAAGKPDSSGSMKISRNDPCPCGSNKKYKKCCGR